MSTESHRRAVARWKRRNPERHAEHMRRAHATYRQRHPLEIAARAAVRAAISRGDLVRPPGTEADHFAGYEPENWLAVRFLTPGEHREADRARGVMR